MVSGAHIKPEQVGLDSGHTCLIPYLESPVVTLRAT